MTIDPYIDPSNFITTSMQFTKAVGNKKVVINTNSTITINKLRFHTAWSNPAGSKLKLRDIRMFELPAGSQIEADFNTMTADQLAAAYPYIQGGTANSTVKCWSVDGNWEEFV